jgi:hypothetical protein
MREKGLPTLSWTDMKRTLSNIREKKNKDFPIISSAANRNRKLYITMEQSKVEMSRDETIDCLLERRGPES